MGSHVKRALLLLPLLLGWATGAHAWIAGYSYRIPITCGGRNSPATSLTAFTCVVRLSDNGSPGGDVVASFPYSHVRQTGTCGPSANGANCDLRFTDNSDNDLRFRIEKWYGTPDNVCAAGHCSTIKVNASVGTSGTSIYLYYGNSSPSADSNVNANPFDANHKAALPFSDASGTTAVDDTGNHNGTTVNSVVLNTPGEVDGALNLQSTGYVTLPASSDFVPTGFMVSLWVNLNASQASENLVYRGTGISINWRLVLEGVYNRYYGQVCNEEACTNNICRRTSTSQEPSVGTWAYLAMVWDGGTTNSHIVLYKNGTAVDDMDCGSGTFSSINKTSRVTGIGAHGDGLAPVNAIIDDFRFAFYSPAYGAPWIKAVYDSTRGAFNTNGSEKPAPTATNTPGPCAGDCNDDGTVAVDDILTMINIALGNMPVTACGAGDANHDGRITVDEILTAVSNALNGCGVQPPTPVPTLPPTSTATNTLPKPSTPTQTVTATATPTGINLPEPQACNAVTIWTDVVGVTISGNTLTKTGTIGWNAGASS